MTKKDNIIDFRDYQPGKRETVETHSLDAFRETLYDLGFLGSSSDTLDETEEVEPETEVEVEETESVSASETVEEPTVEVEVEVTTDPVTEEESMVEKTEPDDEPEVVESEDYDSESDDEEEPEIVDEDDSDEADFLSEYDEEVDSDPEEEDSSEFEEEVPVSRRKRHKHVAPSGAGTRFLKKLGTSFANSLLSNFGLWETPAVQPSKADDEESKAEDSTDKAEKFNSKAQELLSKEIMDGKVDKLNEWSKNDNVNKLMFLFSGNPVLSDWIMENEPDIFWDLPDEIIDVILEKNKKSSEKKDDKDEKKS